MSAILNQIQIERNGHVISRSAVKGCVDVFLSLKRTEGSSVYKQLLEPAVLEESEIFYKEEGQKLLNSCDTPEYLRRVSLLHITLVYLINPSQAEARFESEESRTHHYLSTQTASPLQHILKNELLTAHLSSIISKPNSGLDAMIDALKLDDLKRLYRLYLMVPTGRPCLKEALKHSIGRRGKEINHASSGCGVDEMGSVEDNAGKTKTKERPNIASQTLALALQWVQDVLDLKDRFDLIWKEAFSSDRDLKSAIDTVCSHLFLVIHATLNTLILIGFRIIYQSQ